MRRGCRPEKLAVSFPENDGRDPPGDTDRGNRRAALSHGCYRDSAPGLKTRATRRMKRIQQQQLFKEEAAVSVADNGASTATPSDEQIAAAMDAEELQEA